MDGHSTSAMLKCSRGSCSGCRRCRLTGCARWARAPRKLLPTARWIRLPIALLLRLRSRGVTAVISFRILLLNYGMAESVFIPTVILFDYKPQGQWHEKAQDVFEECENDFFRSRTIPFFGCGICPAFLFF